MTETALKLHRIKRMVVKEIRQLFRDPKTKRIIFAAPVIQLILLGYAVNTDVRNVSMAVVDHDRTVASREFVAAFTGSGYFRVTQTSDRSRDLGTALDEGRAVVAIEIPAGYQADLAAGRSPSVQFLADGTNSNTATIAQGYAAKIVQELGIKLASEWVGGLAPPMDVRSRAWFNPALASQIYNVPAVIGVIVLLMCLLLTSMSIVREREVGTLEQLLVSPLSPGELILGKTIPVAGIAMLQLAIVTTVALLWFDVPLRGSILVLVFGAALFILAGLSVGLFISTISSTQQEAFLTMYLFLLPAIILSGFFYPIETMPPGFRELTVINPLRHFLEIVRSVFLKGSTIGDLWVQFATLAGMAIAGLVLATHRFKRTL